MRTRVVSSVGVVLVGLVAMLLGGPVFAALMAVIGVVGLREYLAMVDRLAPGRSSSLPAFAAIVLMAVGGWIGWPLPAIALVLFAGGMLPLVGAFRDPEAAGVVTRWASVAAGSLYLGVPVLAGAALRQASGDVSAGWLAAISPAASLWAPQPRGLAWLLIVVLAIWVGDSAAYLGGRAFGKRKLAPRLSPNKTVEGAVCGLVGSTVVACITAGLTGLGLPLPLAAAIGLALGVVGQVGDLSESLLKRQAGIKDSGTLIPGHGGMLDRVDALLFALPVGWAVATLVDGMVK